MFSKPFAAGILLALACVTAAGGGAYLAVRQNPSTGTVQSAPAAEPVQAASPGPAVHETEAEVSAPAAVPPRVETPRAVKQVRQADHASGSRRVARASAASARESTTKTSESSGTPSSASSATSIPPARARTERTLPAATEPDRAPSSRTDSTLPPVAAEPARVEPPPPPAPIFDEMVVPAAAVMGLQVQTAVSSERARVEDRVEARVTRDVAVEGRIAVPAGTRIVGSVTLVERGGKVKEQARLGVRFHTLVLADGTELPIRTETVLREGESPSGESTRKIGGAAAGGAILGAIIGGKKGAIIGGATGAAGGTAAVMTGGRHAATLPVGAVLTVRLSSPLTVAVERK